MSRPCQRCQHHAQADVDRFVCLAPAHVHVIPLRQYQARDAACPDWRRTRYPTEPKTDRQTEPSTNPMR
jgi:hypothetical protein